jgi:hypothetical protein
MIGAFWLILACGDGVSDRPGVEAAQAAATTLRHCLKVAGGLKTAGDSETASAHVLACYQDHFVPIAPALRTQNRRAALSLEYGFGLLTHAMTERRSDTAVQAAQLADRVEAVIASLPQHPAPASENGADMGLE